MLEFFTIRLEMFVGDLFEKRMADVFCPLMEIFHFSNQGWTRSIWSWSLVMAEE